MAAKAKAAVEKAVRAVIDRDDQLAEEVKREDDALDQSEVDIDEQSLLLLSKAPLASQLRLITVAMKVSQNLERIGDEATTIARRALELNQEPQLKPFIDLPRISRLTLEMIDEALAVFVSGDVERAAELVRRDKEVDELNRQLHRELSSFMVEDPKTIGRSLNLMVVSKSLERIADHASNVAEEVIFLFAARDVIKVNSMNIDAFEAPESGPLALVAGDEVVLTRKRAVPPAVSNVIRTDRIETRVGLVACYTGMDGGLIDHFISAGTKGLVIEGFGAGNVPPNAVPAIERAVAANIPVVLTTQCPEGGVWPIYAIGWVRQGSRPQATLSRSSTRRRSRSARRSRRAVALRALMAAGADGEGLPSTARAAQPTNRLRR